MFDGSAVRLFVDGREVGSGSPDSSPIAYDLPSSTNLTIGNDDGCHDLGFVGEIDMVRVFDRPLNPREIAAGYQISRELPQRALFDLVL